MKNEGRVSIVKFLLISMIAVLLPLGVIWFRNLPPAILQEESADRLWVKVFRQQHNRIETELGQHDSRFISLKESTARWDILQRSVIEQGATLKEARIVVDEARSYRPTVSNGVAATHWPILIQKGFVRDKRVWVSVCAANAKPCPPPNASGWYYWVRVVDPDDPRQVGGIFSSNQSFIRE